MSVTDTRANCSTLSRSGVLPLLSSEFSDIFEPSLVASPMNLFAVSRLYAIGSDGIERVLGTEFLNVSRIFGRGLKFPAAELATVERPVLRWDYSPYRKVVSADPLNRPVNRRFENIGLLRTEAKYCAKKNFVTDSHSVE